MTSAVVAVSSSCPPATIELHVPTPGAAAAAASSPLPDVTGKQLVLVALRFHGDASLVAYLPALRKKVVFFWNESIQPGSLHDLDAILGFGGQPFVCTEWFLARRKRADHGVLSLVTAAVMDPKVVEKWSLAVPILDFDNYDKPTEIKARYVQTAYL